ncbi:MAG: methylmalonyl Co-A mutase-associated GTPase MeaB [Chloroflexi bacterium]|nr:methylmalonyl Co-A mutase-associated GTPase MeaB [Chloroflexota bacterium]
MVEQTARRQREGGSGGYPVSLATNDASARAEALAEALVEGVLSGDRRALARTVTLVENATESGREALAKLYGHTGKAHIVGITGSGGAGKSTITNGLALELRKRGRTIGIVAVDPSSPFTHGAILGDRIRMQELTKDPDIFIRSMATRGELGGLAAMTSDVVAVLDAAGKDVIIVETVGAGQDEVEIASAAETTVVVLTPASGDDIQAMKAGIMEVADILVVNKADLPGADSLIGLLVAATTSASHGRLETPVLATVATKREGIVELADAIEEHRKRLVRSGRQDQLRLDRARRHVLALLRQQLLDAALRGPAEDGSLDETVRAVAERRLDPYTAAIRLSHSAGS